MKGVNKGPGKAATNRAFADSDEDGGNHLASIDSIPVASLVDPVTSCILYIYSVLLPI